MLREVVKELYARHDTVIESFRTHNCKHPERDPVIKIESTQMDALIDKTIAAGFDIDSMDQLMYDDGQAPLEFYKEIQTASGNVARAHFRKNVEVFESPVVCSNGAKVTFDLPIDVYLDFPRSPQGRVLIRIVRALVEYGKRTFWLIFTDVVSAMHTRKLLDKSCWHYQEQGIFLLRNYLAALFAIRNGLMREYKTRMIPVSVAAPVSGRQHHEERPVVDLIIKDDFVDVYPQLRADAVFTNAPVAFRYGD